jgi:glyoxylase-like metal-dependent hydrolase (beta-lactamase superfamily II)
MQAVTRRTFLTHLGRGGIAISVVSFVGSGRILAQSPMAPASPGASGMPAGSPGPTAWHRVNLGFVSAYLLERGGEVAVVDTGVEGSEQAIADGLTAIGLGWDAVGHVILTHQHPDHAGSTTAVLEAAPMATGYAGAADIPGITSPRPLTAVEDGEHVFDLRIVTTPGHTPGHIAVLDEIASVLVAGDALVTEAGAVAPPPAEFTADMAEAMASIAKLGSYPFETLLVGHGDPIEGGASALVAALGAGAAPSASTGA